MESREFRLKARRQEHTSPTTGYCMEYVQTNVVILPKDYAYDFLVFCQRNPKPCPLLEVLDPGCSEASITAPGSDIRTDVPKYNVLREGRVSETLLDISHLWRNDLVTFLLGCSFSFEEALINSGIQVPHIGLGQNVAMYRTSQMCRQAGMFRGELVVSMRPIEKDIVQRAKEVTCRFPSVHGAPVHTGDPQALGIPNLQQVDWGDPIEVTGTQVPVFWACGVTPMNAIMQAKIPFAVTHSPGHMFITDLLNKDMDIFSTL